MGTITSIVGASILAISIVITGALPASATSAREFMTASNSNHDYKEKDDHRQRSVEIVSDKCEKRVSVSNGSASVDIRQGDKCDDHEDDKHDKDDKYDKPKEHVVITPVEEKPTEQTPEPEVAEKPEAPKEEKEEKETPAAIPSTGPESALAGLVGASSIGYGIHAFTQSRRKLAAALNQ